MTDIAAYVARLVATAPPLTEDAHARVSVLLSVGDSE